MKQVVSSKKSFNFYLMLKCKLKINNNKAMTARCGHKFVVTSWQLNQLVSAVIKRRALRHASDDDGGDDANFSACFVCFASRLMSVLLFVSCKDKKLMMMQLIVCVAENSH